jgi:hypothetical protein
MTLAIRDVELAGMHEVPPAECCSSADLLTLLHLRQEFPGRDPVRRVEQRPELQILVRAVHEEPVAPREDGVGRTPQCDRLRACVDTEDLGVGETPCHRRHDLPGEGEGYGGTADDDARAERRAGGKSTEYARTTGHGAPGSPEHEISLV